MIYILSYFLEHIFISKIILIFIIIKTKTSDAPLTTYSRVWKIESTKEIESETAQHKRNLNRNREAEHQVQQTDEPPSREGADPRRKGKWRGGGALWRGVQRVQGGPSGKCMARHGMKIWCAMALGSKCDWPAAERQLQLEMKANVVDLAVVCRRFSAPWKIKLTFFKRV